MKPGDIIKVKLGHDIHEAELVKENAKTVLVKVLWTKTKFRKVKAIDGAGQANLFGSKVPYTERGTKIIKLPKVKIAYEGLKPQIVPEFVGWQDTGEGDYIALYNVDGNTMTVENVERRGFKVPEPTEPKPSPTPAPQETVREEALVPKPDPFADIEAAIRARVK